MKNIANVWNKLHKKSYFFVEFFWKYGKYLFFFFENSFFPMAKILLIKIWTISGKISKFEEKSRTQLPIYFFMSKSHFCDIWRFGISYNVCMPTWQAYLMIYSWFVDSFLTFLLEFSNDLICMSYLNVARRVIH